MRVSRLRRTIGSQPERTPSMASAWGGPLVPIDARPTAGSVRRGTAQDRYVSVVWLGVTEMKAAVGDRLVVLSRHVAEPVRIGEIVEVHGQDGAPPFVVRWEGDTDTVVVIPGPDAHVEHRTDDAASVEAVEP